MPEHDTIAATRPLPATVRSLVDDLASIGVVDGSVLIVHSSLSSLGWVCGGAVAVIEAIKIAIGRSGTVVMPTHTSDLSEPSNWCNPRVPPEWWPIIRDSMPAFDPRVTPSRAMGAIAECFRTQPNVVRSSHPHASFAAYGPLASELVSNHSIHGGLGDSSPLGRLYDHNSSILLIGVGHDRNTSLHLSEMRSFGINKPKSIETGAPMLIDGKRQWIEFIEPELDESRFPQIGKSFQDKSGLVQSGMLAQAQSMLIPQRALVDFGTQWLMADKT